MSFSSTCTSSSGSVSPSPTPFPNYKTLESLLLSLISLTRKAYSEPSHRSFHSAATQYLRIHSKLNIFFAKHQHFDFVGNGTYGYCLEVEILLRLIESRLGTGHRHIPCLQSAARARIGEDEMRRLKRRVNTDVEWLVFRGAELDCERLPWNVGDWAEQRGGAAE